MPANTVDNLKCHSKRGTAKGETENVAFLSFPPLSNNPGLETTELTVHLTLKYVFLPFQSKLDFWPDFLVRGLIN